MNLEKAPKKRVSKKVELVTVELSPKKIVTLPSALEKKKRVAKKKTGETLSIQEKKLIAQEKHQEKKMLTEGIEKKRRLKKSLETKQETEPLENEEVFRGEGGSTIFTGPENLPFESITATESVDYQPNIDEVGFDHIVHGKPFTPETYTSHEKDLTQEFGTVDPDEIHEEIARRKDYTYPTHNERVAEFEETPTTHPYDNYEYTYQIPLAYKDPVDEILENTVSRPTIDKEYGRYISPSEIYDYTESLTKDFEDESLEEPAITPEELYAPLLPRERKTSQTYDNKSKENLFKRFWNWIGITKSDAPRSSKFMTRSMESNKPYWQEAKKSDKQSHWLEKFKSLELRKDRDSAAINKFVDEQHRSAVAREINENSYKQNLAADERAYEKHLEQEKQKEAALIAAWAPYLKERSQQEEIKEAEKNAALRRSAERAAQQKNLTSTPVYEEIK